MDTQSPKTLMEAVKFFSDPATCNEWLVRIKWPDGVVYCPDCAKPNAGFIKSRNKFQCREKDCRRQFSAKIGTVFEDSALGLDKWFVAVWCITNAKNGISSCELARAIGVTQKSAWHMLHRIRYAMKSGTFHKMGGTVEADEGMIGGKVENYSKGKKKALRAKHPRNNPTRRARLDHIIKKTIVMGLLERGTEAKPSQVRTEIIRSRGRPHIQDVIRKNVEAASTLITDKYSSYQSLEEDYVHKAINHALHYAVGAVHTNGIENFWSLLERTIHGTYVFCEPGHLEAYLDEQAFRFNNRDMNDGQRFQRALGGILGKRLTYAELVGKSESSPS